MSANSGPLKPGTQCWLTGTIAANIGKVVEVIRFQGVYPAVGDVYWVKTKEPLVVSHLLISKIDGVLGESPLHLSGSELAVLRKQLIPMNDPDAKFELESLFEEIQEITLRNHK